MKKILFVAMAATMFAACTQNEELENAASNKEMKFNTAVMSTTRAGAMTNEKFTQFKLYAYTGTENVTAIINGELFTKTVDNWGVTENDAEKTFYWPGKQEVKFYGYSVETIDDTNLIYDAATVSTPTLTYTVKSTIGDQEDLLIPDVITQDASKGTNVSIAFKHALTKMSFKIAGDDNATSAFNYAVKEIKVKANTKGTYQYSTNNWDTTTDTSGDFILTNPTNFKGGDAAVDVTETLMMIPQTGATIAIKYTISTTGVTTPIEVTKEFTFNDWTKGRNIAYTIKLPSNEIQKMTVTALFEDDWKTETPNEIASNEEASVE